MARPENKLRPAWQAAIPDHVIGSLDELFKIPALAGVG